MNQPTEQTSFLIVGLGLAGMSFAFQLHKRGIPFLIMDPGHLQTSSRVAAGMWNPVGFKRLNEVWMADELVAVLQPFYRDLGDFLGEQVLFDRDILRVFPHEEAKKEFLEKSQTKGMSRYMSMGNDGDYSSPHGHGIVKEGGYLALGRALDLFSKACRSAGLLVQESFEESSALWKEGKWEVQGRRFDCIVNCTGTHVEQSSWWDFLPLRKTKGELLRIKSASTDLPGIVNNGKFTFQIQDGSYLCGSTYDWKDGSLDKTEHGFREIMDKVSKVLAKDLEVAEHRVGIRPTVIDRRPILGKHPEIEGLAVFNGLGARGVMLAPYFSAEMASHLIDKNPLSKEVDLMRFRNKHYFQK